MFPCVFLVLKHKKHIFAYKRIFCAMLSIIHAISNSNAMVQVYHSITKVQQILFQYTLFALSIVLVISIYHGPYCLI